MHACSQLAEPRAGCSVSLPQQCQGCASRLSSDAPAPACLPAAGAGLIGISILTCGFFIPPDRIPAPLWRYPLHYVNFITYAFAGLMGNEFEDSGSRWQCPCLLQVGDGWGRLDSAGASPFRQQLPTAHANQTAQSNRLLPSVPSAPMARLMSVARTMPGLLAGSGLLPQLPHTWAPGSGALCR